MKSPSLIYALSNDEQRTALRSAGDARRTARMAARSARRGRRTSS
jgi:hypothetical protein